MAECLEAVQPRRRTASPRLAQVMNEVRVTYRALLTRGVKLGVVRSDLDVDTLLALAEAIDIAFDDQFHQNPAPDESFANEKAHQRRRWLD